MDRLVQAMEGAGFTPREIEAVCWKTPGNFTGGFCKPRSFEKHERTGGTIL